MAKVYLATKVGSVDLAALRAQREAWYSAKCSTPEERAEYNKLHKAFDEAERAACDTLEREQNELLSKLDENDPKMPLVGVVIYKPVADGKAAYLIAREKPLELHLLDLGDGYRYDLIWERGLRVKDAREEARRMVAMHELFHGPKAAKGK